MKLRNKILIGLSIAWLIFLGLTYVGSKYFLIRSFLSLEHTRADEDLSRVDQALDQIDYSLFTFTTDWAHWTDFYHYMQGTNPGFIPGNLNMTAYINSHINVLTYWDKQGKLVFATAADMDKKKLVGFPKGIEKYFCSTCKLIVRWPDNKDIRGYAAFGDQIALVAAATATDGDNTLPPLGTMANAYFFDDDLIKKIEDQTKVKIELFTPSQIDKSPELKKIFDSLPSDKSGHYSIPIAENTLNGYTIIKDINDKPIAMFRMTTPRAIYQTGLEAINYYLIAFVALGIIFSLLMLWLLRVLIVKRLEKLDKQVAVIGETNAIDKRVDATGNDELSGVSAEINSMLDIIQAAHDQLENRVQERTKELQKANIQLNQEIHERKAVERELIIHKEHLVRLAHYDNLTTLPNRVFFNEILNKALAHAARQNKKLAVIFIDLDRFKTINDALGHTYGDLVLKEMGTRLSSNLRAGDIIARLGGDEYIILLNDIDDPKFAGPIAEKLLASIAQPLKVDSHEFFITASAGISIFPEDGTSLEDLQKNADMAMYKAKHSGGGNYQYYSQEMDVAAHQLIELEASLRKAIQNNEFVLHYQPQLSLKDGKIKCVEALIRWNSPDIGMVSPAKFIPLAEETGLIMPIGEWALREACRQNKEWQDQGFTPITVAVNISPKQFRHQDVAAVVSKALQETGLQAQYLEVEITESAVMENADIAVKKLHELTAMGVEISVDDFGTGYTSINYLRQFPVNVLKIDQTFIKGIPNDTNDLAITSAVIALGHNLGLHVVAEGVETAEQMQYLAEHNCDLIQGYYFSRPLPANKIIEQFSKVGESLKSPQTS